MTKLELCVFAVICDADWFGTWFGVEGLLGAEPGLGGPCAKEEGVIEEREF